MNQVLLSPFLESETYTYTKFWRTENQLTDTLRPRKLRSGEGMI